MAFQVNGPRGRQLGGTATYAEPHVHASNRAVATGWHEIVLTSNALPHDGAPFTFKIEYTAPQSIRPEEF